MEASGVVLDMAPPEIFAKCQSSQISSFQSQGLKQRLCNESPLTQETIQNSSGFTFYACPVSVPGGLLAHI